MTPTLRVQLILWPFQSTVASLFIFSAHRDQTDWCGSRDTNLLFFISSNYLTDDRTMILWLEAASLKTCCKLIGDLRRRPIGDKKWKLSLPADDTSYERFIDRIGLFDFVRVVEKMHGMNSTPSRFSSVFPTSLEKFWRNFWSLQKGMFLLLWN